jgi:hypothetical protein
MEFVAIIMLKPEIQESNPNLTPLFLSKVTYESGHVERHAGTPPRNYKDSNNIQTFYVSKSQYVYYNYVVNFPDSLSGIEDYLRNT